MKKWFPFVLSVLCLLSVRFSLAQEPFFRRGVEIRINGSGACVLPDGSFVLCGNDGTVSDDRPAKAVCVNPYGDIVWEVTDKYAESAANDFLSLAALPSGDIMLSTTAHFIKDDTVIAKHAITRLLNGRVTARYEQAEALGGAMIPMGEGFLCPTIDVSGANQSTHLTLYNAQCMPVRSFSSPKKFTIAALLPLGQNHLLVGSVITEDVNNRTTNGYLAEMDASGHLLWSTQSRIPGVSFSDAFLTGIYYVASARETSVNAEGARERRYITCIGKVEAE